MVPSPSRPPLHSHGAGAGRDHRPRPFCAVFFRVNQKVRLCVAFRAHRTQRLLLPLFALSSSFLFFNCGAVQPLIATSFCLFPPLASTPSVSYWYLFTHINPSVRGVDPGEQHAAPRREQLGGGDFSIQIASRTSATSLAHMFHEIAKTADITIFHIF